MANRALSRFENHLIETQRRISDESRVNLEKQLELQKLKVAAAKAKMDEAFEKLKAMDPDGDWELEAPSVDE